MTIAYQVNCEIKPWLIYQRAMQNFGGSFQALGSYSLRAPPPAPSSALLLTTTTVPEPECAIPISPSHLVLSSHPYRRFGLGSVATSVKLDKVRRIRISAGLDGHCRTPLHVSGLMFEFWHSTRRIIIGQWFQQVGILEIGEDDKLSHIGLWHSQYHCPPYVENLGMFTGIKLITSRGLCREVRYGIATLQFPHLEYSSNRFEELVSSL